MHSFYDALEPLLDALESSAYFEDASHIVIERALERAERALEQSEFSQHAQILRGVLHLRPEGPYRGLVLGLATPDAPPALGEEIISSATLWQWVATGRSMLTIDVTLGLVTQLVSATKEVTWRADGKDTQSLLAAASMQPLLNAGATHLAVVPLRDMRGEVVGMISIEARCRRALGRPFIWRSIQSELTLIARLATPYLLTRPTRPEAELGQQDEFLPVIGDSMLGVIKLLRLFARQNETILLMGPTGSGKSRLAAWCHARSLRAQAPFEVLDLLAIPESMQLAHLVGWRKGAFTGADRDHQGAIARAHHGTLFIDEIDKLSLETQAGLLRLLEERLYRPLGAAEAQELTADVRFIVGTNVDLRQAVLDGDFREDLYYRINVLPTRLPALCERKDELSAWALFMAQRAADGQRPSRRVELTQDAKAALQSYTWPGNLRQLDNVMRRAHVIASRDSAEGLPVLIIDAPSIQEALQIEGATAAAAPAQLYERERVASPAQDDLLPSLAVAAQRFVQAARQRALDLDCADAFKGLVLYYANMSTGGLDETFTLFGREAWVSKRNHHRVYKREQERVALLLEAIEEAALPAPLEEAQP